jgi:hypothetical protein
MLKECKTSRCQIKLQQLQWKEQGIEKDHVKGGVARLRGFKCNENKRNWSETIGNGGRLYWRPRYTTDCSAIGGGRGGGEEEATEEKEK